MKQRLRRVCAILCIVFLSVAGSFSLAEFLGRTIPPKISNVHAADATTYYVSEDNGNNSNTGTSKTTAFKTLKKAKNTAVAGDTIAILDSVTINEDLIINMEVTIKRSKDFNDTSAMIIIESGYTLTLNGGVIVDGNNTNVISSNSLFRVKSGGTLNLRTVTLQNNTIKKAADAPSGGAIKNVGTVNIYSGATIKDNVSRGGNGGAVYNTGTLNLSGGTLSGNKAGNYNLIDEGYEQGEWENLSGGAIFNSGTVQMSGGTISGNVARSHGGGIYNTNEGTMEMVAGTISNNTAYIKGGGVGCFDAVIYLNGGTISGNTATNGGGVYVTAEGNRPLGECFLKGTSIESNEATESELYEAYDFNGNGGGVGVYSTGTLYMSSGEIKNNTSEASGGGIYQGKGGHGVFIEGNTIVISGNSAEKNGGGIFNNSHLEITDAALSDNIAGSKGGSLCNNQGSAVLTNTKFTNTSLNLNTEEKTYHAMYGGAIYNGGALEIKGSLIEKHASSNHSGGICNNEEGVLNITNSTISENTATTNGGGIYNNGEALLFETEVVDNIATTNGGGIYNSTTGNLELDYTYRIVKNTANKNGGGLFNAGNAIVNSGSFTGNTAGTFGNGIFQNGNLYFYANADINDDNEVFLNTDRYITVMEALNYDIVARITPSDYTLGRTCAVANWENALGSDIVEHFTLTEKSPYLFRAGDWLDESSGVDKQEVIISRPYSITYNQNTENTGVTTGITNIPESQTKYWYEASTLSDLTPTLDYHNFVGWDTNADLDYENESPAYQPSDVIAASVNEDLKIYALWDPIKYNITYVLDGGINDPANPNSYTYGVGVESFNEATKEGCSFAGWYFDDEFSKECTEITKTHHGDVTLYAKWTSEIAKIYYLGNNADSGSVQSETVYLDDVKEDGYEVKDNEGFTDFVKETYTFTGWDQNRNMKSLDTTYAIKDLPESISYDEFMQLAESTATEMETEMSTLTLRSSRSGKTTEEEITEEVANGTTVIALHAIWDNEPVILPAEDSVIYYEGEEVSKEDLLALVTASDAEDGDITSSIKIKRISYSAGRELNGTIQDAYESIWEEDMPEDGTLDTWFLTLPKNPGIFTHVVSYEVTDSYGNTVSYDFEVKVKYNEFPEIFGEDRYFTLEEAQDGHITAEELLSKAFAKDIEDDSLFGEGCLNDKIQLIGYNADEFVNFKSSGYVVLHYKVHDSMGPKGTCDCTEGEDSHTIGKEAVRQFVVYITDGNEPVDGPNVKYVRFIDNANYIKNKDAKTTLDGLSGEERQSEIDVRNKNGGLNVFSKWYLDLDYITTITDSFSRNSGESILFNNDKVNEVRDYATDPSNIGNLDEFINRFFN